MATERDVYEIDTDQAEDSLKKVAKEFEHLDQKLKRVAESGKQTETVGQSMARMFKDDLTQSVFSAQAAYDILKQSIQAVGQFVLEGIKDFEQAQQVQMRLATALRNVGGASEDLMRRLNDQSTAIERLTGIDGDYLAGLQAMLTTMGVAPQQLERFTKAAVDLATATGQDAKVAAQQLARAHAEGKEELKKYGIEVTELEVKSRGFVAVLEQVEARYGRISEQQPELIRQTNELHGAWKDFKETIGEAAASMLTGIGGKGGLVKALDSVSESIKRNIDLVNKTDGPGFLKALGMAGAVGAGVQGGLMDAAFGPDKPKPVDMTPDFMAGPAVTHLPGFEPKTDKQIAEAEAERKRRHEKALADAKKYKEDMEFISGTSKANLQRMEEEEEAARRKRITEFNNWEQQAEEERVRQNFQIAQSNIEILKSEEEERQRLQDARLAKEREFWSQIRNEAMGALESMASAQLQFLAEMITSNTEYHRQMFELEVQRRTAGMAEVDAQKERARMEKQLANERGSAYLKMTADSLANIAQQAAVKAVMESVEAIAALAIGNAPGAALHGTAAAGYAGVAVLAGGSAAILSSARGMTSDERKQLEGAQASNAQARRERETKQASEAKAVSAGTVVNVYNLGISGQTEAEQAKELERIRSKFADMRTGSSP